MDATQYHLFLTDQIETTSLAKVLLLSFAKSDVTAANFKTLTTQLQARDRSAILWKTTADGAVSTATRWGSTPSHILYTQAQSSDVKVKSLGVGEDFYSDETRQRPFFDNVTKVQGVAWDTLQAASIAPPAAGLNASHLSFSQATQEVGVTTESEYHLCKIGDNTEGMSDMEVALFFGKVSCWMAFCA